MANETIERREKSNKLINRTFSLKEKFRSKSHYKDKCRPSLKINSKISPDNSRSFCIDTDDELSFSDFKIDKSSVLMQAYRNLLYALFDPVANINDEHFFQMKSFMRIFTHDKTTESNGAQTSAEQTSKPGFNRKSIKYESINENATANENQEANNSSSNKKRDSKSSTGKLSLTSDSKLSSDATPNLFSKLNELFKFSVTESVSKDIDEIRQHYAATNGSIKRIKSVLKVYVKKATNLIAQDSCGTSDPYVTIQCGNSKVKKTKTIKKTLNPVWNELIQFEFISSANSITGDQGNDRDELLIRVYDEDYGIKGQLDRILTIEDFLGQITLKLNDLNIFGEHSYQLKPRNNKETVTGTITLVINLNSFELDANANQIAENDATNFVEQYRILHLHVFDHIFRTRKSSGEINACNDDITWMFESIDLYNYRSPNLIYFKDFHFNLLLSYFANKYVISEIHRQIFHLECFYTHFIDLYFLDHSKLVLNRDFNHNSMVFAYINCLLNKISTSYLNKTLNDNDHLSFLRETCILPFKLTNLIMNYRQFYPIKYGEANQLAIKELKETIGLFRNSCNFIQKNLVSRSFLTHLKDTSDSLVQISGYCEKKQFDSITQCIEISFNTEVNNILYENEKIILGSDDLSNEAGKTHRYDILSVSSVDSSTNANSNIACNASANNSNSNQIKLIQDKIDTFMYVFTAKKLLIEIDINDKYYFNAFTDYFFNRKQFKSMCIRLILKELLAQLLDLVSVSQEAILYLHPDDVKQILNLYLFVHRFIIDNNLEKISFYDLLNYTFLSNKSTSNLSTNSSSNQINLNELFQPFLLVFIREQESKFISYIDKLYDMNKINILADEIDKSLSISTKLSDYSINSSGETSSISVSNPKYYSSSVTDLFTILHELLDIILQFDTNIDTNLIKNKLLIYIAHVKNEYYKLYHKSNSINPYLTNGETFLKSFRQKKYSISLSELNVPTDDLTIKSCILINNFQKSIELLDDIEHKLNSKTLNKENNIDSTLKSIVEVLEENINYMIREYCKKFITPFNKSCEFLRLQLFENDNSAIPIIVKFIDDVCYRIFNNKLKICKIVLFDAVFKKLLIEIFKTTLACIEEAIIMRTFNNNANNNNNSSNNQADSKGNESFLIEKFEKLIQFNYKNLNQADHEIISDTQYSTIKIIILRIIDFFSADEEVLKKSCFTELIEYKKVLKSLELNHMSSSSLISLFVQTQKLQNSIDLAKSYGKIRLIVEIKQSVKLFNEFTFILRLIEAVDMKDIKSSNYKNSFFSPCAEVHVLGPKANDQMKSIKMIEFISETNRVNFDSKDVFTFKLNLFREKVLNDDNYLDDYEVQIVVKEAPKLTEKAKVIGVAVLNLNEVLNAAIVWKRLIEKEKDLMFNFNDYTVCGALDLWLPLRAKLKLDEEGVHILKVLDKHKDKSAANFIYLKSIIREY